MKNNSPLIEVARIGRLVGLKGELKLNIHSDFPEQFKVGRTFSTQKNLTLKISSYNEKRALVAFEGYGDRDSAAKLVNSFLFTTPQQSEADCNLEDGEFYWYDVIGSSVLQEGKVLGLVKEIERIGAVDYLVVTTDKALVEQEMSKTFYVPYIDRYIIDFDEKNKQVNTKDTLDLLENS